MIWIKKISVNSFNSLTAKDELCRYENLKSNFDYSDAEEVANNIIVLMRKDYTINIFIDSFKISCKKYI